MKLDYSQLFTRDSFLSIIKCSCKYIKPKIKLAQHNLNCKSYDFLDYKNKKRFLQSFA